MTDSPTPRSYAQVLGDMIAELVSGLGVDRLKVGSPLLSVLEAAAHSDMRTAQDVFQFLSSIGLDRSTGVALLRAGADEDLAPFEPAPASGDVTIVDSSFTKIASRVSQAADAPIAGTLSLAVADAADFPTTGRVFIGRGTLNVEGPIDYSAKTNLGDRWVLTLSTPTQLFHNQGETVVVGQGGNRIIQAQTVVQTPQSPSSPSLSFQTQVPVVLLDGEDTLTGVPVGSLLPGTNSNVPVNAISQFESPPFTGATVRNTSAFSNGSDAETPEDFRGRIRQSRFTRTKGTSLAINLAVQGAIASDEGKRIASSSLVRNANGTETLYVDDGTGYEEIASGISIEVLADSAVGGEDRFQVSAERPITKAFLESQQGPFILFQGATLAVLVGGQRFEHTFNPAQFQSLSLATAYEVASSINSDFDLQFSARTADSGSRVVIVAKADENEDVQVVPALGGVDCSDIFLFPSERAFTTRLYKNDRLLTKGGDLAVLESIAFASWQTLSGSQTLLISVDGTPVQTVTVTNQDFVDLQTGYATVGNNSIEAWATVLNAKIAGAAAVAIGSNIVITSHLGRNNDAALSVTGGTLVTNNAFAVSSAAGRSSDYTMNRAIGDIFLAEPLDVGDRLTLGSIYTESFVQSAPLTSVTVAGDDAKFWVVVDGAAESIPIGINASLVFGLSTVAINADGHILSIMAGSGTPFVNVAVNDWIVLSDSNLPASLQNKQWRVVGAAGNYIQIERAELSGRIQHTVERLSAGAVLAIGGNRFTDTYGPLAMASVQKYNPTTKVWSSVGSMNVPRYGHCSVVTADDYVIVMGGFDSSGAALDSCEIFDPITETWSMSSVLPQVMGGAKALRLDTNRIVVCGGQNSVAIGNGYVATYSAGSLGAWGGPYAMASTRREHSFSPLTATTALVAGGYNAANAILATAEIFDVSLLTFTATGSMAGPRAEHAAVAVAGNVVAIGGWEGAEADSATVFSGASWSGYPTMDDNRRNPTAAYLSGTDEIVVVGASPYASTSYGQKIDATTPVAWGNVGYEFASTAVVTNKSVMVALNANEVLVVGGEDMPSDKVAGRAARYNAATPAWVDPDPAAPGTFTLAENGMAVVRSDAAPQEVTIAIGTYTAQDAVADLDPQLDGGQSYSFQTNKIRIATNTLGTEGSVALVNQNAQAASFGMDLASFENTDGYLASVVSAPEARIPDFRNRYVVSASTGSVVLAGSNDQYSSNPVIANKWLIPLQETLADDPADFAISSNTGAKSFVHNPASSGPAAVSLSLRTAFTQPLDGAGRAMLADAWAIGPNDNFLTTIDNNQTSARYNIGMARRLATVGNVYGNTNVFTDAQNSELSLGYGFGLNYDFNDHVVYMKARAKTNAAEPTRVALWRFWRHGPEGNKCSVRYVYPTAPSQDVLAFNTPNPDQDQSLIDIRIPSGAAKTSYSIRSTTRIGYQYTDVSSVPYVTILTGFAIASATRAAAVATLTLTMPGSVHVLTDHGLQIGDRVFVTSSDVNYPAGLHTITGVSATTITYNDGGSGVTPGGAIGTVSADVAGVASFENAIPSAIAVGDILNFGNGASIPADWRGQSVRVAAIGPQYIQAFAGFGSTPAVVPSWAQLNSTSQLSFFVLAGDTVADVVTAVNAQDNAPIGGTLLGAGSGALLLSTAESASDYEYAVPLRDGINYVESTSNPMSVAANYSFTFKYPIEASLATASNWVDEDVRVAPVTTADICDWFAAPGVSGLFSRAWSSPANQGGAVQIASRLPGSGGNVTVLGGSANSALGAVVGQGSPDTSGDHGLIGVRAVDTEGLLGGAWLTLQNVTRDVKLGVFGATTALTSIAANGVVTLSVGAVYTAALSGTSVALSFEHQGDFVAIIRSGDWTGVQEGHWLNVRTPSAGTAPSVQNRGTFRVVRVDARTIWIENPLAIAEAGVAANVSVLTSDSLMPGDTVAINSSAWGAGSVGQWNVVSVGGGTFSNPLTFTLQAANGAYPTIRGSAAALGAGSNAFTVTEANPKKLFKQIVTVLPNDDDQDLAWVRVRSGFGMASVSENLGTVFASLGKLAFPLQSASGSDGYKHSVGLIGEAAKLLYGSKQDTLAYRPVVAEGATIYLSGPLVKRATIAVALRARRGVSKPDLTNRVKSAIATVINQSPTGRSFPISDAVAAAAAIGGIEAVSVVSPLYTSSSDVIAVQPFEKLLVIDLDQDILISYIGE